MRLSPFPSHSLAVPLRKPPSDVLAYLEAVLHQQAPLSARWPSERARLTGSVAPGRIVLRIGTRHRWVVFVGHLADDGGTIRGVFEVSLPERLLFACWYALLGAIAALGVATSLYTQASHRELSRLLAVSSAVVILGFFATRLSWLGRKNHVAWIADLIRRAAQPGPRLRQGG